MRLIVVSPFFPFSSSKTVTASTYTAKSLSSKTSLQAKMAEYKEDLEKTGAGAQKIHKIRITLTSKNVKPLEKC